METPLWLEILKVVADFLSVAAVITVAYLGYRWAHKYWLKEKEKEIVYGVEQARFEKKLESCKAVWALLAYLSEKENAKTIFVVRGDKNNRQHFVRKEQAVEFLKVLPEVFYEQGHGIFMPPEVRKEIYSFRSRIYRILEDAKREGEEGDMIGVKNEDVMEEIRKTRDFLIHQLREEVMANP